MSRREREKQQETISVVVGLILMLASFAAIKWLPTIPHTIGWIIFGLGFIALNYPSIRKNKVVGTIMIVMTVIVIYIVATQT